MPCQPIDATPHDDHTVQNTLDQLQSLLPGFLIRPYAAQRTIILLDRDDLTVVAHQQFTGNEWAVFTTLLLSYPHYASHKALFAAVTKLSLEQSQQELCEAQAKGVEQTSKIPSNLLHAPSQECVES